MRPARLVTFSTRIGLSQSGQGVGIRLVPRGEFAFRIFVTAVEDLAPTRFAFFDVAFLALGTFDAEIHRLLQRLNIFAFGIAAAAEKLAELAPAQQHRPAALLTSFVDFFLGGDFDLAIVGAFEVFGALALGILRTSEKLAVAPPLDHHLGAALIAVDVGRHFLALDVAHLFFGFFEVARERRVKALHRLGPLFFAVFDLVELVFHAGGELDV